MLGSDIGIEYLIEDLTVLELLIVSDVGCGDGINMDPYLNYCLDMGLN